ncbi:AraC family transcriptional regulator [Aureimonas sp. SK2]|uniref:AraC family transcriptional regulator n=1 Tax=Aureimonas sp. SK2 TaxID=3015992 RepID=UPI0024448E46|nr:AraC family transcriptional regulator [Aureimonas sp. SK2]
MTGLPLFRWERFVTAVAAADLATALAPLLAVPDWGAGSFPVEFDARATGGSLLLRLTGRSLRLQRAPMAERKGGWDHRLVLLLREGRGELSYDGSVASVAPGDHVLLDMSRAFAFSASGRFEVLLVFQPRGSIAAPLPHGTHRPAAEGTATLLASHADYLLREAVLLDTRAAQAASDAFALLAHDRRNATGQEGDAPSGDRPALLRRYLAQHAASPQISPESVAQALGVSRAALYRTAGPEGGVAAMLLDARLRHAVNLLLSCNHAESRIAEVARAVGFSSLNLFSRRFGERYGLSPMAFRALFETSGEARVDPRFALWLAG